VTIQRPEGRRGSDPVDHVKHGLRGVRVAVMVRRLRTRVHTSPPRLHSHPSEGEDAPQGPRERVGDGPSQDQVRQERQRPHRLPGRRRRACRPGVRARVRLERRVHLAGTIPRKLPPPAHTVRASHHFRQTRNRAVRPRRGRPPSRSRDADGRHPGGYGRRRIRARRAVRCFRRDRPLLALRRNLSRPHGGADSLRRVRKGDVGRRLPVVDHNRGMAPGGGHRGGLGGTEPGRPVDSRSSADHGRQRWFPRVVCDPSCAWAPAQAPRRRSRS
jgi:hypothetical protein